MITSFSTCNRTASVFAAGLFVCLYGGGAPKGCDMLDWWPYVPREKSRVGEGIKRSRWPARVVTRRGVDTVRLE